MIVIDLSLNGIGFKTIGSTDIEQGHRLRVQFTHDNKKAAEVERDVTLVNIRKNHYGCQFLNQNFEKELGFYPGTWRPVF